MYLNMTSSKILLLTKVVIGEVWGSKVEAESGCMFSLEK